MPARRAENSVKYRQLRHATVVIGLRYYLSRIVGLYR